MSAKQDLIISRRELDGDSRRLLFYLGELCRADELYIESKPLYSLVRGDQLAGRIGYVRTARQNLLNDCELLEDVRDYVEPQFEPWFVETEKITYISSVEVNPVFRRNGLASKLLRELERNIVKTTPVVFGLVSINNQNMRSVFERVDYYHVGCVPFMMDDYDIFAKHLEEQRVRNE